MTGSATEGRSTDVGVVIVTYNALPHIERCLDSVRGYKTVVVDNGSADGTADFVIDRYPDVALVRSDNLGLAAGWSRGIQALGSCGHVLVLNADAWVEDGAVAQLAAFADAHRDVAIVGPQLRNPDGTLQPSARAFPTVWRLATEYLLLRRVTFGLQPFSVASGGGVDHGKVQEVDWLLGAVMLIRTAALEEVGLPDEEFFLFTEETDWCYRFHQAGWKVVYYPDARATHVGEASHGGRMVRELARSNLRYMQKHHGERAAERARRVMLVGVGVRALLHRGAKRAANRDAMRWLRSGSVADLLARPAPNARVVRQDRAEGR